MEEMTPAKINTDDSNGSAMHMEPFVSSSGGRDGPFTSRGHWPFFSRIPGKEATLGPGTMTRELPSSSSHWIFFLKFITDRKTDKWTDGWLDIHKSSHSEFVVKSITDRQPSSQTDRETGRWMVKLIYVVLHEQSDVRYEHFFFSIEQEGSGELYDLEWI